MMLRFWNRGSLVGLGSVLLVLGLMAGCGSSPSRDADVAEFQRDRMQQARVSDLNQQLAMRSLSGEQAAHEPSDSYELGVDDLVEVTVLGVPELSRDVRVDGNGSIALPLIGEVHVEGKTVAEASNLVAARYAESYLRDPQVSVLIKEYRSQRITVLGAVRDPKVYAVQRRMGVLEALALAGGLTEKAGRTVYVNDRAVDPDTGERIRRNLVLGLDELIHGGSDTPNFTLGDGAVINVPQAGVVYVEGAVMKPGMYPLQKETSVLKAIAMAGGLDFSANGSSIHVLRVAQNGMPQDPLGPIDIEQVRQNPGTDIELNNGDVVVVGKSAVKAALKGFVDTTRGFFGFGYSLNR